MDRGSFPGIHFQVLNCLKLMGPKTCQHCAVLNLHCIPLCNCLFSKTFLILYLYEMTAVHQHFYGHHFMMYASQIIMLYTLSVYSAVMPIIFQWNWSREAGRPYCPTLTLSHSGVWPSLKVLVAQLCLTLCDPMDCSPPGSSVQGILHTRILQWVAIPFSKGSSWPGDQIRLSLDYY